MEKEKTLKRVVTLYIFILLVWGFYRFLFRLPIQIEEMVLKPLVWLGPIFFLLWQEKKDFTSLGFTRKNLGKSLGWGALFGALFLFEGFVAHAVKYRGFSFLTLNQPSAVFFWSFLISLFTALSEETVFRGYIFNRLWQVLGEEWPANFISSLSWVLINVPISIFLFRLGPTQFLAFLVLNFIFGVGSAFAFARTKNLTPCLLIHIFWGWPMVFFS